MFVQGGMVPSASASRWNGDALLSIWSRSFKQNSFCILQTCGCEFTALQSQHATEIYELRLVSSGTLHVPARSALNWKLLLTVPLCHWAACGSLDLGQLPRLEQPEACACLRLLICLHHQEVQAPAQQHCTTCITPTPPSLPH